MAELSQLAQLEERRRNLLARSDCFRRQLAEEFENLRHPVVLLEKGWSVAQSLKAAWPWVAMASGFVFASKIRRRRSLFATASKVWSWWRLARKLYHLWQRRTAGAGTKP